MLLQRTWDNRDAADLATGASLFLRVRLAWLLPSLFGILYRSFCVSQYYCPVALVHFFFLTISCNGWFCVSSLADQSLLSSQAFFMTWDDHEVVDDFGPDFDTRNKDPCEQMYSRPIVAVFHQKRKRPKQQQYYSIILSYYHINSSNRVESELGQAPGAYT